MPSLFILGLFAAFFLLFMNFIIPILLYGIYFALIFVISGYQNKSLKIGLYSIFATGIQFYGYGTGFLESFIKVQILKKDPEHTFPALFFKTL